VTTRDAFRRGGPFVGSGGPYNPGPATTSDACATRDNRWMTLSRHPGPTPILDRSLGRVRRPCVLSPEAPADVAADNHSELGPRSLAPPPFLERCARAYSGPDTAYRLLQLRMTRGHCDRDSRIPRWDGDRDPLPFLTRRHSPSCDESDTRRAARSVRRKQPRCRFLPFARVCPTAMTALSRDSWRLSPAG
jgi:hypothetical protein